MNDRDDNNDNNIIKHSERALDDKNVTLPAIKREQWTSNVRETRHGDVHARTLWRVFDVGGGTFRTNEREG